ncbi:tRNA uracil 4-sulfurtransferase ThiI [Lentibacillus saliphilus]|uniref:tRNA uracil 4-sulfurtransferase ThiI n=1 Tax=Lentibacillus saliphilus TaxID=2737028 RepID=UPI001C306554|nr:tRNA uracil 4-sulfurtransferase ThiI [Lentibacillus saliphilus]
MKYDHIMVRYSEIALKGGNRKMFLLKLQDNINRALKEYEGIKVKRTQGRVFILLNGHAPEPIIEKCRKVFGIHSLSPAMKLESDLEQIQKATLEALTKATDAQTFKIIVKRIDKTFPHRSQEMNQLLGSYLLKNTEGYTVDVHHPDVAIKVEIRNEATYVTSQVTPGAKGLPVGTAGKTLLLLSGGIDSPVAGYLAMKRGVQLEAIHFHSPPFTSERAKQKVLDLADVLTAYGTKINIHIVPFTKVQQTIFREMPDSHAMTIMRRIMLRISERVCRDNGILSMTTGESLGQVASQTMYSMHAINDVTSFPILRPLIAMDKEDIIHISRKIGTYDISVRPYEDCCTVFVPKSPKTKPQKEKIQKYEAKYDFTDLIDEAVAGIETVTRIPGVSSTDEFDGLL